jgi:hypothetical protein
LLSIGNVTVEPALGGTASAVFAVTLSPASAKSVTVQYATANGTATAPSDYTATSGVLTFGPGQTSQTVTVVVKDDPSALPNSTKTFTVKLSAATGAPINQAIGTGTITEEAAQVLYAIGSGAGASSSTLYEITGYYTASPKAVSIGATGALLTDLAIDPQNGSAYAISTTDLYLINLNFGKAVAIGPLGVSGIDALAFSSTGVLYAMAIGSSNLYTINATTGRATLDFATGYSSSGSITVGTHGALYLTTATDLVRINLKSKKAIVVGSTGVFSLFGLAFGSDGTIYAGQSPGTGKATAIYKIDDSTGHATKIGTIAGSAKLGLEGWAF